MTLTTSADKAQSFDRIQPGQSTSTTIYVPGAETGDLAIASLSTALAEGCILSAAVIAVDEVRVTLANLGTEPAEHPNTTITAVVFHRQAP